MKVVKIFIYPVKSTHRIRVAEAAVNPWGLQHDRRWMVVDDAAGFLTQREEPRLAQVQADITSEGLVLTAPGMAALAVAFPEGAEEDVTTWNDSVRSVAADELSGTWFTRYLGRPCRLVYMRDPYARPADATFARPGSVVSFADGYPLLMTSEASLADLNRRMSEAVPMTRFRPNVVIDGRTAFEEDTWKRIRIGQMAFDVVKPCTRCVITTIDQESGHPVGREPLRKLNEFRKYGGNVYFGENLVPVNAGTIRVGDEVELLERRAAAMPSG